ncbi:Alpha/Beta hydrolase protein [Hypoxylon cercidicola]|nr:Alpha/Beta hydrolase protein [Hypoxylon cercidicola]
MLPRPNLSFTLPSIHDSTKLDCRIYHPTCLTEPGSFRSPPWRRHAAVVAHPYAPLGGCYDDPVVAIIAGTLLQVGFVVTTFNFRGASSSDGRTSWTSKPERADYMSVASFLVYYVHYLRPPHCPDATAIGAAPPTLLLAGYSYGAMVTIQLPPLSSFLAQFASPPTHTALADIRLRAQHLAEQQIIMDTTPASPRKSLGMRVGGSESTSPQKAHERPRIHSPDREEKIRRGVRDLLSRSHLIHRKHDSNLTGHHMPVEEHEVPCLGKLDNLIEFRSAYLMVSPPLGIVTNLATLNFSNPFSSWSKRKRAGPPSAKSHGGEVAQEDTEAEAKLTKNPTLVIYGDQDGFLSMKKMRDWTGQLSSTEGTQFYHVEVSGAGHFWIEEGVLYELREAVFSFASRLIGG